MGRSIRQAVQARDAILSQNQQILGQALSEVNKALAVTQGDLSGRDNAEANRLKGILLLAQATTHRREADRFRMLAEESHQRLAALAGLAVLAILVVTLYCAYVGVFRHDAMASGRKWFRVVLLQVLYLLIVRFSIQIGLPILVVPMPLFALLFCLLTDRRFSIVVLVVLSALSLIIPGADPLLLLVLLLEASRPCSEAFP